MREEYDFSGAVKNPYAEKLKKVQITIKLDESTVLYFKGMADESGVPYQTLINLYLSECVREGKKLHFV